MNLEEPIQGASHAGPRLVTGEFFRVRRGNGKDFATEAPPSAEPAPSPRPARVAIMLALAHKIQEAIDRGDVRDRAEVARRIGVTRARMTQLLELTLLAPDIQSALLDSMATAGAGMRTERELRAVCREAEWVAQRRILRELSSRNRFSANDLGGRKSAKSPSGLSDVGGTLPRS